MKAARPFILLILATFCYQKISAQTATVEKQRIERLAGLAKVWGAVKYFHPYLADREIDWDKALVETIPRVNAAKSPQEYNAAINHLLSFLNDGNTVAVSAEGKSQTLVRKTEVANPARLKNDVLTVEISQIARLISKNVGDYNKFVQQIEQSYSQSKAVIFDVRGIDYETGENAEYIEQIAGEFFRNCLPALLDKNVRLGSVRYRFHNGYEPQSGGTSGGYYSGFITDTPKEIFGQNKVKTPPVIIIFDEKTPPVSDILSGLQAEKLAMVIQDGASVKEPPTGVYTLSLPDDIKVKMRMTEIVKPDNSAGFEPDVVVPKTNGSADEAMAEALKSIESNDFKRTANKSLPAMSLQSYKDKTYPEMEYPGAEYRLLGLFRFWNAINYFYPYKDLIEEPWDNVLREYIPKFEADKSGTEYVQTVQELMAETHDSHTLFRVAATNSKDVKNPKFYPPVWVKFIENQTVVTAILDETVNVKVGEIVTEIDGVPVQKYGEKFTKRIAASTPQSLQQRLHNALLSGDENSKIRLTLRDLTGSVHQVDLTRNISFADPKLFKAARPEKKLPVYTILPEGFGYADLARLDAADVDKMFEALENTPAIIFDLRGYPRGTAWEIAPHLTGKTNVPAALLSRPYLTTVGLSQEEDLRMQSFAFTQYLPPPKGDAYKGKIVVLINEDAISQAEHTALFFEAATDVTFVGTPTTGADGDVTNVVLPGNLVINFTGHNVRHADGQQLQRVGIQPTVKVAPTVLGVINNRDEILEAAIKFLGRK